MTPHLQDTGGNHASAQATTGSGKKEISVQPRLANGGLFSALRHYNFRLYFFGLLISVTGMWAQNVAQAWLVYELTGSSLVMGQVVFVSAIPVWIFSPWAGVVIDRVPRRVLLFITQTAHMLQAFALAALTFSGHIEVWHVMVLSTFRGMVNAFDAPARQSFYVELVEKQDLSNAIALNSTLMSLARVMGPAFGGLIVASLGAAWAFTINGVTFLAILGGLVLMRIEKVIRQPSQKSPLSDLVDGVRYIFERKMVVGIIINVLAVALFGASFDVLLPIIAAEVLGMDEVAFGMLNTARGLGSVAGAILMTYISRLRRRGHHLIWMTAALGISLVVFAFSRSYIFSLLIIAITGLSLTPQLSLSNMLLQAHISDEVRGRVMAVYTLVIFGTFPIGNFLAGAAAEHFGTEWTIAISGVLMLLIGLGVQVILPQMREIDD